MADTRRARRACGTCQGYGLWAIGDATPMGPMDAATACPRNHARNAAQTRTRLDPRCRLNTMAAHLASERRARCQTSSNRR